MLIQNWLPGVQSLLIRSHQMSRMTRRRQSADGAVSAEVLEVRRLLAANITATLVEAVGENECPEDTGQNAVQSSTTDVTVSENSELAAATETTAPPESTEDIQVFDWWGERRTKCFPEPSSVDSDVEVDLAVQSPKVRLENLIRPGGCVWQEGDAPLIDLGQVDPNNENPDGGDPTNLGRVDPDPAVVGTPQDLPPVRLENGILTIYGTNKDDDIDICVSDFNTPNWFSVMTGFVPIGSDGARYYSVYQAFDLNDVREIRVFSGDGNDRICKFGDFGSINAILDGGGGNDILQGDTHDQFVGGEGDDFFATSDWESVAGEYVSSVNLVEWQEGDSPPTDLGQVDPSNENPDPGDPTNLGRADPDPVVVGILQDLPQMRLENGVPIVTGTVPDEIEHDDNGTTENEDSSENAVDIDLAFTDFMSPL